MTKYNLISYIFTLLLVSVNSCSQMPDQKVLQLLSEKYDKDFSIIHSKFKSETGLYYITASPTDDPDLEFNIEYNPTDESMVSYFEEYLWRNQARSYFEKELADHYDKLALNVDVTPSEEPDSKDIPSFSTMLDDHPEDLSLAFQIHLFQDLKKSNSKELLAPIADLISDLIKKDIKSGALMLSFYDQDYFNNRSLDDYSFGFANSKMEDFEEVEKDQFSGKILLKFDKDSKKPSPADLFEFYTEKRFSFKYHKL